MSIKKTLTNIISSTFLAGSLLVSPSYSQEYSSPQKQTTKTYEITKENPAFSDRINMDLYHRSLSGNRDNKLRSMNVYLEGSMDYEKNKFYFSYSAGDMTKDGPLLYANNIGAARRIPRASLPEFNDSRTKIYVVSTSDDVRLDNLEQKAYVYGSKTNPIEIKDVNSTTTGKVLLWGMKKLADKAIEVGDTYLLGGLNVIPYIGDMDPAIKDKLAEKFDLGPLSRIRGALEKREKKLEEGRRQDAFGSLENAVFVDKFPVNSNFRIKLARSYELDLKNVGFEDEKLAIVIDNLPVINESNNGVLHGQLRDISFVIDVPSRLKNYLGGWRLTDIIENGNSIKEQNKSIRERLCLIKKDQIIFKEDREDSEIQDVYYFSPVSINTALFGMDIGIRNLSGASQIIGLGALRTIEKDKLAMVQIETLKLKSLENFVKQLNLKEINRSFSGDRMIFERDSSLSEMLIKKSGLQGLEKIVRKDVSIRELETLMGDWFYIDPEQQKKVCISLMKDKFSIYPEESPDMKMIVEDIKWSRIFEKIFCLENSAFKESFFLQESPTKAKMRFNLDRIYTLNGLEYADPTNIIEENFSNNRKGYVVLEKTK